MSPTELQDRIQKLFDEDLSAEEFGELEAELLENPEALKTYCVWVDLHCRLQKNGSFQSAVALTLIDDRSVLLDHGRAFVRISSEEGKGFTVVTAHQRIVDLGTAFGVDARIDEDDVVLSVFDGQVRVDALDGEQGEVIETGRSVLLSGKQVQKELRRPIATFFRQLPSKVEFILNEDFESGLVGGRDYAVRIDPTSIRDLAGNRFAGIDDDKTWNFTAVSDLGRWTLLHHWEFEGDVIDSAGSGNGTLHGNVGFAPGRIGRAATFDGDGDFISMAKASLPPTDFSMSAWVFANKM